MVSVQEKGGGSFEGIKMLLCENPLPPLDEAIEAAAAELLRSNYYTEAYSLPLRQLLAERLEVPERLVHVNAGSELILRQLFGLLGQRVHLLTPTYPLFLEIAQDHTETPLDPEAAFTFDLGKLDVPAGTTMVTIVNPNNPTGHSFDMTALPRLLERHPDTFFLVDEAFVDFATNPAVSLVGKFANVGVTQTLSKAHSLAGFRVGYCVMPQHIAGFLNTNNDAYPLARAAQAAAIATLQHEDKIKGRVRELRSWAQDLASELESLGVRTFPSESYFFLADFSPHDASHLASLLRERDILIKPLNDERLGPGYMRVTTALPVDNEHFVTALREVL